MIVEEVCAVPFVVCFIDQFYKIQMYQVGNHFIMGGTEKFNCYKKNVKMKKKNS
jgi:hypothetical protein